MAIFDDELGAQIGTEAASEAGAKKTLDTRESEMIQDNQFNIRTDSSTGAGASTVIVAADPRKQFKCPPRG